MTNETLLSAIVTLSATYIVLSIAASAIAELLLQFLRLRGRVMAYSVRQLLGSSAARAFYKLPVVTGLAQGGLLTRIWISRRSVESPLAYQVDYIDKETFTHAVRYLAREDKKLEKRLAPFARVDGHAGSAIPREPVERWFDQAVKVARRQYRRTVQAALFWLGLLLAVVVEADSVGILGRALMDADAGQALVGQTETGPSALSLLFGVAGYATTAGAVALGAQYWFDLVGRLLGLRSSLPESVQRPTWGRAARRRP